MIMELNIENVSHFLDSVGDVEYKRMLRSFIKDWKDFSMPGTLYEILTLKDGTEVVWQQDGTYYLPKHAVAQIPANAVSRGVITSVKRKSDGEIFKIGDKCYDLCLKGDIERIYIDNYGRCLIECSNDVSGGNKWLRIISQIGKY